MRERKERESQLPSEWQGNVGDKIQRVVTIYSKGYHESDYGTSVRLNMRDAEGNVYVTFGSGSSLWDAEVDTEVTIKGSIKKLDEFRGIKQTILTRVKVS
jgi:hypothetical protein